LLLKKLKFDSLDFQSCFKVNDKFAIYLWQVMKNIKPGMYEYQAERFAGLSTISRLFLNLVCLIKERFYLAEAAVQ